MPTSTSRQALADAIAAQHAATDNLRAVEETAAKAQTLLAGLYAQLSDYDHLDAEIAEARANMVRKALERGEAPDFDAAPEGFASRIIARDRISSEITALREPIAVIDTDVAKAKFQVEQCALEVEWAAEVVYAEDAERLAADYVAALNELRRTAYLLSAMALRQISKGKDAARLNIPSHAGLYISDKRRIDMPRVVHEALEENVVGSYERRHGFNLRNRMGAQAQAHWAALLHNAEARLKIEDAPPAAPKFDVDAYRAELENAEITTGAQ